MDKQILVAYLLITIASFVTSKAISTEGYYWRDYNGVVPVDAFSAGFDSNGKSIYIGQVLMRSRIIPGIIYKGDENIYYEWKEKARSAKDNVKILCTQQPENLKWIKTSVLDLGKLNSDLLVNGGYQHGFKTYIGRVYANGENEVGKVICRWDHCLALYAVKDKKYNVEFHKYEILSYNPENSFNDIFKQETEIVIKAQD